jgi:O-antigen ligase
LNKRQYFYHHLIFLIVGVFLGYIILFSSTFPLKWLLYFIFALVTFFILLGLNNKNQFVLFLLIIFIPIRAGFFIGNAPHEIHIGGAARVQELNLVHFALLALYIIWLIQIAMKRKETVALNRCDIAAFGLICWSVLSLFNSEDLTYSVNEILRMMIPFFVYFYIAHNVKNERHMHFLVNFIIIALLLQIIIGLAQMSLGQTWILNLITKLTLPTVQYDGKELARITGTTADPTTFAQYLCLFLPIPLSIALFSSNIYKRMSAFLLYLFGSLVLFHTITRMGIIGIALGSSILFFLYVLQMPSKSKALMISSFAAAIIITFAMINWETVSSRFLADDLGSAASRIPLDIAAFRMIQDKPFLGVGLNNFVLISRKYGLSESLSISPVHNVYLFFAAETGIPGLLILLYFIIEVYKKLIFVMKSRFQLSIFAGILSGITSLLVISMVDTGFKNDLALWNSLWLLMGLVVASSRFASHQIR